ncbi:hypothetical protein F4780DRAFT_57653 [Xylariomycetidae sp. FL0641]|nr:hypothetical protein F4780DRAFT_57653 [Xylariomycetidae sp. FL0641]
MATPNPTHTAPSPSHARESNADNSGQPVSRYRPESLPGAEIWPRSRYARIKNSRDPAKLRDERFYTDKDVLECAPKGSPSLAAHQMFYPNCQGHRVFADLTQRALFWSVQKLACLEDALDCLALEAEQEGHSLKLDRQRFLDGCLADAPDGRNPEEVRQLKFEKLMDKMVALVKNHLECLNLHRISQGFPKVSDMTHQEQFELMQKMFDSDPEALDYARYMGDVVTTSGDDVFHHFERFLDVRTGWVQKLVRYTLKEDLDDDSMSSRGFRLILKALFVVVVMALILPPTGILYLGGLTKAQNFGVVTTFGFLFAVIIASGERQFHTIMYSTLAIFAVMVALLATNG